MPIIESLIDTDLYKLTMQQVVFHQFPDVNVAYEFRLRNYPQTTLTPFIPQIVKEIEHLCTLRFQEDELRYLERLPFISDGYIEFLRNFKLNPKYIYVTETDGYFGIYIKGPWLYTILYEVPVLAIVSETFSTSKQNYTYHESLYFRLMQKIKRLRAYKKKFVFSDFGTRRRFSLVWQNAMIDQLARCLPDKFVGTSNVFFAKKFGVKPIGTMAHEYIQAMQALVRLQDSQQYAFQCWANEYRGRLGIALSDTLGMEAFLNDFDLYFSKLFEGARHDSGDPRWWCDLLINHYYDLDIEPKTKTAVFSDGLTIDKSIALNDEYSDSIKCAFGIGTHLTNDSGLKAPQIVIKMVECDGRPVAKISDSRGKQMCNDKSYLKYLASVFNIKRDDIYD